MRARYGPILALALATIPTLLLAAPPVDVPAEVKGEPGAFVTVRAKTDGKVVRFVPLDAGLNVFPGDLLTDRRATVVSAAKPGRYRVLAYSSVKDDPTEPAIVTVVIGNAPAPPGPVDPVDPVDPPKPVDELKTFRVVLVFESGATLTQKQFAVMYGKPVSDWLDANTTKVGESAGWRRYDKDVATGDKPEFATMWANKPALPNVPCALVERNGKLAVVPFADTPDATISALTKAREGK